MSDITYEELTQSFHSCSCTFARALMSDITYEELTLAVPSPAYKSHHYQILVGHYLWGIDTNSYSFSFQFWMKNRSDITYEELTLCKFTIQYNCKLFIKSDITYEELTLSAAAISLARDFKKCRTLPMRNWHLFVISFCIICLLILSICRTLPMRNWHHLQGECITKINHGKSDITYEELTHIISGPFIILSRDVISISRTLPMRNWHTGYRMFQSACLIRRTLPMRNWHDCRESWKLVLFQWSAVGHYLWGIDTHLRLS